MKKYFLKYARYIKFVSTLIAAIFMLSLPTIASDVYTGDNGCTLDIVKHNAFADEPALTIYNIKYKKKEDDFSQWINLRLFDGSTSAWLSSCHGDPLPEGTNLTITTFKPEKNPRGKGLTVSCVVNTKKDNNLNAKIEIDHRTDVKIEFDENGQPTSVDAIEKKKRSNGTKLTNIMKLKLKKLGPWETKNEIHCKNLKNVPEITTVSRPVTSRPQKPKPRGSR